MRRLTALVVRSLRCETRAWQPHLLRLGLAGGGLLMVLFQLEVFSGVRSATGRDLLRTLAWAGWVALALIGFGHFASSITEEKEEGSLDLMRMAGLSPLAILLGKSAARLWDALLLVGCVLPLAVLAVTLGGVSLDQVWAVAAVLAGWAVFLAGLGVLASVVARTQASAAALTVAGAFLVEVAPGLAAASAGAGWYADALRALRDGATTRCLDLALGLGFSEAQIAWGVAGHLALGLAGFVTAWRLFDRCARDTAVGEGERGALGTKGGGWLPRPGRPGAGAAAQRWKDFHFIGGGWPLLVLRVVAMGALVGLIAMDHGNLGWTDLGQICLGVGLWWLVLDVGLMLSRVFVVEVRWRTLSGLAGLDADAGSAVLSKLLTVLRVAMPAILLTSVGMALAWSEVQDLFRALGDEVAVLAIPVVIVVGFWHLCAVGSLYLTYAAFFAAIGVVFALNLIMGLIMALTFRGMNGSGAFVFFYCLVFGGLCVFLHVHFHGRWRALAAR